jgi:class 3 adenylate cyclase/tetratricopeptide (TPR) repeat protein
MRPAPLEYGARVGNASSVICTSCGQDNPAASRFCAACGALLAEPSADVRKTVTVVFCDLVGSTALGETRDPEILRALMARYHAELRSILERHGGTVEKFAGDAAMAIFGVPLVHEDDALRAVRAAVEMRDAVSALGLEVHVGVDTGEIVAGTGETLATGDAVNVAARLEQAAAAGEILIGTATERLVRDAVRTDAVEPLVLKGKRQPVPAFRLLELLDTVPAFTRRIDAPFVGRENELEELRNALASAVETRTPQLATIVGPPGIGKSRLARELLGRVEAHVVVGRCLPYGEAITYWPLQEIASQVGDVRAVLKAAPDTELAAIRIEAALGMTDTPVAPEEIAWGVRRLLEVMASNAALVVVFDDIHWAEPAFLDLIEYVAAFAQDVPLFILCTARPDLFELRPTWTAPKAHATLHTLDALTEGESEMLVEQLGDLSEESRERIVVAAEGNPLFVEQLVAMQAESGNGELEVPPTLQALLASRIDRLAEHERAVAQRGSVEGRLFHRGAVAALLPGPERPEIGMHLMSLVRKELIRPDRATLPGDDGFRFGHILIRDAAYDAIPKRQRAVLHERFADWLEEKLGDDAPDEVVGYHLEHAYRYAAELGIPDPQVGSRAAERLAAAARAAMARQDIAAAVNLLGRAVELIPDSRDRPLLYVRLGEALNEAGEPGPSQNAFEEGVALAREVGDEHAEWLGRVWLTLVQALQDPDGATERMFEEATAAVAAREAAADHEVLAVAWGRIAVAHSWRGETADYMRAHERAVSHARRAGSQSLEVNLAAMRAPDFIWGPGRVDEGLLYAEEITARLGHVPGMRQFALHLRAHLQARLGEFDGALEALGEYRSGLRELGKEREYTITAGCVWDVCSWSGDLQHGEAALREAYERLERSGNHAHLSTIAIDLGEAIVRRGDLDEAEQLCRVGEELSASDDVFNETKLAAVRARIGAAQGDLDAAESLARRAADLAAGADFIESAADAWLTLATILRARGDPEDKAAALESLRLYETKGNLVGAGWAQSFLQES